MRPKYGFRMAANGGKSEERQRRLNFPTRCYRQLF